MRCSQACWHFPSPFLIMTKLFLWSVVVSAHEKRDIKQKRLGIHQKNATHSHECVFIPPPVLHQREIERRVRDLDKEEKQNVPGRLHLLQPSLGGRATLLNSVGCQEAARHDKKPRPKRDRVIVQSSKPKSHSTAQTAALFGCFILFSPLLTLQRFVHFISFLFFLLDSLTQLQPGGFLHESCRRACVKYSEDGVIGSEARTESFLSSSFFVLPHSTNNS